MYLLGFDIGSSSVKVSLVNGETGECVGSSFSPKKEMIIYSRNAGWAEQDPEEWWNNLKIALCDVLHSTSVPVEEIESIGISYQMHGLVLVDKNNQVLRPSIIWCDSRATEIGNKAFNEIGGERCLSTLLNSPGNFTASKLKWVKDNEPSIYDKTAHFMLPGDYIAYRLSGEVQTTVGGLSEGILWNFKDNCPSKMLMDYYGIDGSLIPSIVPTFSVQSELCKSTAKELGLREGIKISYRGGDQPNNALSLNVLNPGEVAATAGTSGVVYGVSDDLKYDPKSRVNTFAHVNYTDENRRLGILLCINGTGILNSWLNKNVGGSLISYEKMNEMAASVAVGSDGLIVMPFGNGAERVLENKNPGAVISGLQFNTHNTSHLFRAAQEGIAFSFRYGMEILEETGMDMKVIRAGMANMFLSPVFRETLAGVSGTTIELYNTDGSVGAARGAGIGSGYYNTPSEAFVNLKKLGTTEPDLKKKSQYLEAYEQWKVQLKRIIKKTN